MLKSSVVHTKALFTTIEHDRLCALQKKLPTLIESYPHIRPKHILISLLHITLNPKPLKTLNPKQMEMFVPMPITLVEYNLSIQCSILHKR